VPELNFRVEGVEAARFAAAPMLIFKLRIDTDCPIHTIALRCQIRIEPTHRRYQESEQRGLIDLFGVPERWKDTLHSMLWTHINIVITGFSETTLVDLPAPCTFDFNVASAKYFSGLDAGRPSVDPGFQLLNGPDPAHVLDALADRLSQTKTHILASQQEPSIDHDRLHRLVVEPHDRSYGIEL